MSVVIAIKDNSKKRFILGCDTQASGANLKIALPNSSSKIWKWNDCPDLIFGAVGRLRGFQLLQTSEDIINTRDIEIGLDYNWLVQTFVPRLFKLFVDNNLIEKSVVPNSLESFLPCEFIIAIGEQAFRIETDGSVIEIIAYDAIGSGVEVSLGILNQAYKNSQFIDTNTIISIIKNAIESCADTTLYINNEVNILMTNPDPEKRILSIEEIQKIFLETFNIELELKTDSSKIKETEGKQNGSNGHQSKKSRTRRSNS